MGRKKISEFDKLVESLDTIHSKKINALMVTADDADFQVMYFKLLEYAKPKLQRSEIIEEAKEQKITIVHVYGENDSSGIKNEKDGERKTNE